MATMPQKLVAEFVGTFILVATVCNAIMSNSPLASISIACSLMVGIYSFGPVSGANFNPAVSSGLFLSNVLGHKGLADFDFLQTGAYKIVQLLAGLCAALFAGTLYGYELFGGSASFIQPVPDGVIVLEGTYQQTATYTNLTAAFPGLNNNPLNPYETWSKLLAEVFYTCMLVFTVLNTATNPTTKDKDNHYFGLAIGFVIMAGANGIGHISGCSLNPAVSFGLAMGSIIFGSAQAGDAFGNFFLYSLAEVVGAALAAVLFHVVRAANVAKKDSARDESLVSRGVSEFIGTFYLILTVCLVCSAPGVAGVAAPSPPLLGVVGIASSLMVMIYALGNVSGANFNPAVTLGLLMRGEFDYDVSAVYWLCQLLGGLFAVGMASVVEAGGPGYNIALVATRPAGEVATLPPLVIAGQGTWGQIFQVEFFYTFLLVFVVLNAAAVNGPNNYFGLAIGMCVTVGGIAGGGISGGCFNPAVSFALGMGGLWARTVGGQNACFIIYWVAQLLGAAAAAGVTGFIQRYKFAAE